MTPRSKYSSLTSVPGTYAPEEWELAVSIIEFLPHTTLVALNTEYGVTFSGGNDNTDDESLSKTLLHGDIPKEKTMEIIERYKHTFIV